jgi:hypothetical protein
MRLMDERQTWLSVCCCQAFAASAACDRQTLTSASVARTPARLMPLLYSPSSSVSRQTWRQRLSLPWPASVECFSSRNTLMTSPLLPTFSVKENRHFISSKTPESRLASSAGGREDHKPLSTPQTPSPLQMCQHQQVITILCTCVSIFIIIFKGFLVSSLGPTCNALHEFT